MELALISFATLLFLLSGLGAQAQASKATGTDPVPRQHLLRRHYAATSDTSWCACAVSQQLATLFSASRFHTALLQPHVVPSSRARDQYHRLELHRLPAETADQGGFRLAAATTASSFPLAHRRRLYRTRFGFANGAYRALGPPPSGLLPRFR